MTSAGEQVLRKVIRQHMDRTFHADVEKLKRRFHPEAVMNS